MSKKHALFLSILSFTSILYSADWPQFRGINRDGISPETGLLKKWPENGPNLLWQADGLGEGWSSAAISKGVVYITGKIDRDGWLFAFDTKGKSLWKVKYGPEWGKSYKGARSTPTVVDDKLYIASGNGVVYCLSSKDGSEIWSRDAFSEFEGKYPVWGMSECLLVDGRKVFFSPGGKKASVIAMNRDTGDVIWACDEITDPTTYGSPRVFQAGSNRILVQMLEKHIVGINAETGKLLWSDAFKEYHTDLRRLVTPNIPYYRDGYVYSTSGYDNGGALHELSDDGTKAKRIWADKNLDIHHGGFVVVGDYIYGANWLDNRSGNWVCIRFKDAKKMYEHEWNGNKGNITYADGMLYCWDENDGDFALVKADPAGFNIVSSFEVSPGKGMHWAHPAISDGRLYIRHGEYLQVYDIKE